MGFFLIADVAASTTSGLSIGAPSAYHVFQRVGTTGSIPISGNVGAGTHDIQARFNGGMWATIASSASGTYSGTLTNQAHGQGTLEVRWADTPWDACGVRYVGIGDVFAIAGQSNAGGQGSNNQTYISSGGVKACLFGNDYGYKELVDPVDSTTSQVDLVSRDGSVGGSVWPLVATRFLTNQVGVPVMFIPCSLSATPLPTWLPGADHQNRASLYGSMAYRAIQAGGVKAVLFWQGESDAEATVSQATYFGNLTNFTANVAADLGAPVMQCKFQNCSAIADVNEARITDAIGQAWASDSNMTAGPDLTDLGSDDGYHLKTDGQLATAAERWWDAIKAAFYP